MNPQDNLITKELIHYIMEYCSKHKPNVLQVMINGYVYPEKHNEYDFITIVNFLKKIFSDPEFKNCVLRSFVIDRKQIGEPYILSLETVEKY